MNILIVYYSRTGLTKKACEKLLDLLSSESTSGNKVAIEQLIDHKKRSGAIGYTIAAKDAMVKSETEITPIEKNMDSYDHIILATPVWAFTMTPAMRTFIKNFAPENSDYSAICTMGGSGDKKTFADMEKILNKTFSHKLTLIDKNIDKTDEENYIKRIEDFVRQLKS
jgi:flavodoxin